MTQASKTPQTRAALVLGVLGLAWVACMMLAPLVGSLSLDLGQVLTSGSTDSTIFWQIRWPRVLLALLAGGSLAICGAGFQTLFGNPLAEPYTLGIASGAALGAVTAIHVGTAVGWFGFPLVAIASFFGALAATAVVVGLAIRPRGVETGSLLLAGIAVSLSCSAIILFIQYLSDSTQTFRMVRWMMGGLAVVGYGDVLWLAPWAIIGTLVFLALRWDLNLLLTGEELAASRGLDLGRLRVILLVTSSLMIGAMVAVTGPIGFVGLMVPHMLRRSVGYDHRLLLPACFLAGGVFLTLADVGARTLMAPAELPVGILTALGGGPFFLWLMLRRRRA